MSWSQGETQGRSHEDVVARRHHVVRGGVPGARPMLFAHGFGCDQSMWRHLAPHFAADHEIVLFDHVGAGASDLGAYDPDRYDVLDGYAEDVAEICEASDLRDVVLVAHSVSTMIAVLAAGLTPRIAELVLLGPSPRYVDEPSTGYRGGFTRAQVDDLLRSLATSYLGWVAAMTPLIMGHPAGSALTRELTDSLCRMDPAVALQLVEATFLSDHRAELPGVRLPTLVVQCSLDVIAPVAVGEYVHAHVPGSVLRVVETSGHCPHLSVPGPTARVIAEFLGRGTG